LKAGKASIFSPGKCSKSPLQSRGVDELNVIKKIAGVDECHDKADSKAKALAASPGIPQDIYKALN
jgi:hypothetical protein